MSLSMRITKTRVVFDYKGDDMAASFELLPSDDGAQLEGKLEKMLAFLRRERQADQPTQEMVRPALAAVPAPGNWPQRPMPVTVGSAAGVGTLMQQGLQHARPFTGIPPVQPVPLEESLKQVGTNGWELITEDD
jgi:hypothetical protein